MIYVVELVSVNSIGGGGGGGYYYYVHILVSRIVLYVLGLLLFFFIFRCMIVMTLLLHMLYVIGLYYFGMLMVRYYRCYTIVTYDICVMASVAR